MERRIVEKDGIFFCCNRPVPPWFHLECEAELVIRLCRTRSGSADWWVGDKVRSALNDAPRNPVLRAVVNWFYWTLPREIDLERVRGFPDRAIQAGESVFNWMAEVKEPLPDPQREFLAKLVALDGIPGRKPEYRQGNLEIHYSPNWPEAMRQMNLDLSDLKSWLRHEGAGIQVFNHYVSDSAGFFRRVIRGWMIVLTKFTKPVWVLSRDHPDEPIRAESHYDFVLLAHPLPLQGQGD